MFKDGREATAAFTLLELMVVIVIMGLLAAIGLPAIRGMNKSNGLTAADRQLLDDINYARQRAMADHTSVYMVFVPPSVVTWTVPTAPALSQQMNNLYGGQYTTYALLSLRSVGEQPGRSTPRYLTGWRTLPGGIYIATNKFIANGSTGGLVPTFFYNNANRPEFPFPVATNFATAKTDFGLPHFGFNYLGQLIYRSNSVDHLVYTQGDAGTHMYIPLAQGSLFFQHNPDGTYAAQAPDVAETVPNNAYYQNYNSTNALGGVALPASPNPLDAQKSYNQIYIDPLTGRAKVERLQIQ
jgi:prepilin-type N-terminal cleavage/methylation domain-containing protein